MRQLAASGRSNACRQNNTVVRCRLMIKPHCGLVMQTAPAPEADLNACEREAADTERDVRSNSAFERPCKPRHDANYIELFMINGASLKI